MDRFLDKTIINLITILISGAGLFAVLTKFGVPELHYSYFGRNPFAVKGDIKDGVMTWIFTLLALLGILVQVVSIISNYPTQERIHTPKNYTIFFVSGICCMAVLLLSLASFGNYVARKKWLPEVMAPQIDSFKQLEFIIGHDGLREDQLEIFNRMNEEDKKQKEQRREQNWKDVNKRLTTMEKLLELPHNISDPKDRLERIRPYLPKEETPSEPDE